MGYSFKPGESIPAGVKRIVADELESAACQLEGKGEENRDEAIHEARKSVKKIRGVLKLMRRELAGTYTVENQRFRDLGHKLAEFRDAGAMLEMFDQMREKYAEEWRSAGRMAGIRDRLQEQKIARESSAGIEDVLTAAALELRSVQEHVKQWPLHRDGFAAIAPGLEATYRDGRRAMHEAIAVPSAERFHDWRKRVKDHWYQIRLLGKLCGEALSFYQNDLKNLETHLGDDHNLAVLKGMIEKEPQAYGGDAEVQVFLRTLDQYQPNLRDEALSLGKQIFEDKPKVFLRQVKSLWEAWNEDRERIISTLPVTG